MIELEALSDFLSERLVPVIGAIARDSSPAGAYYVFVEVQRDARGRQEPSNAYLAEVRQSLAALDTPVDFILVDGATRDAEAGLRATLLHSCGSFLRNSFLAVDGVSAVVWVVPKRVLTDEELTQVSDKASVFLESVGITLRHLASTSGENLPSKTKCLAALRQIAPATVASLADSLRYQNFVVPSHDWMSRRLDALRKSGMVVRLRTGGYVLSLQALRALGTIKGRGSPDVARLLALARSRR
ncbi:hypothetical protein [Stenotrophomonas maltophilia]|uniref:hypothetical protein n=1 Tax=Stenotrophomonas maltophilia TaxID=40324 RepID=UPI0013100DFB